MDVIRTPDERFANLPEYPFSPHYLDVDGLRMHYVDEGPRDGQPVLMLHGEPSWSYLYRKMIPVLTGAGHRAIAPDLIGFGRSDKPVRREDYTYQRHMDWLRAFVEQLDLRNVTLVCQDWGSFLGLRLVAENEYRFARIVVANGFLPTGDVPPGPGFLAWRKLSQESPELRVADLIPMLTVTGAPADVRAAYDAPFPDERYRAGARQFPMLVPIASDDPATPANRAALDVLKRWRKPFLTAFGDADRAFGKGGSWAPEGLSVEDWFQKVVPGAAGQPHTTIAGAGHFIQEDKGAELARAIVDFMERNSRWGGPAA